MDSLPITADDLFMSSLSPTELNCFARTSKAQLERVLAFKRRAFNIETLLRKYFTSKEVENFRTLQSQTQMIISGSTALQFFNLTQYPDSDLDIYVEHRFKERIIAWLVQIGYELELQTGATFPVVQDAANNQYVATRGIENVYNFHKHQPERKIQLITSTNAPLKVILNFHSTCVMNVITHDKAYALYPKPTFEEHRSLIYSTMGSHQEEAIAKYASRGWSMIKTVTRDEVWSTTASLRPCPRYVGDEMCWTIEIHPKLDLPESFIEINSWSLRMNDDRVDRNAFHPHMPMMLISDPKLRFSYTLSYGIQGHPKEIQQLLDLSTTSELLDSDLLALLRQLRSN